MAPTSRWRKETRSTCRAWKRQVASRAFHRRREDPALIGRNVNKVRYAGYDEGRCPALRDYHAKSLLSGLGLDLVESGGTAIMNGEVKKSCRGSQSLQRNGGTAYTLSDPAGKVLWVVETTGTSSRFGIGYKADNYYEVLSDALVGAVHELASNANFKKTLSGK